MSNIVIIQGHPDPVPKHLGHWLAAGYRKGAEEAGHQIEALAIANLGFSILRTKEEWDAETPPGILRAQEVISWANHILVFYPLWLGGMPALLKGFWEQVLRPGFAVEKGIGGRGKKLLTGKSARIIVTMGMPAPVYRWYFRAHSLKSLERNILAFTGIGPIESTLIGGVETADQKTRDGWMATMHQLGRSAK